MKISHFIKEMSLQNDPKLLLKVHYLLSQSYMSMRRVHKGMMNALIPICVRRGQIGIQPLDTDYMYVRSATFT